MTRNEKNGKVYLVGAGPGDPGLITVKGLECLKKADVVIYDRLINAKLLQYAPGKAEIIYCGKSPRKHTLTQEKINVLLVKKAKQGKTVIRLKCGDPFLFGRGAEEALYLSRHKIAFEIIPGVSAALAVPAYAGIPLTHRAYTSSVGIFTGHQESTKASSSIDWEKIAAGTGTLVFLMGVENLAQIVNNLIRYGRPNSTPCCLIQQGTLPEQKSIYAELGAIVKAAQKAMIKPPAILVAGEVVSLRNKLNWFESRPLSGKRILITRALGAGTEDRLLSLLEDEGAFCLQMPAIEIKPLKNYTALDSQIKKIDNFQWIIFSSQNGMKFFKQRLDYLKKDLGILKEVKVAAIGPGTAGALENSNLSVDLKPSRFCQEGLLKSFKKIKPKGQNILIVCAKEARDVLLLGLIKMGAKAEIAPAYRTVKTQAARQKTEGLKNIDIITFTSAQTVKNFFQIFSMKAFRSLTKKPLFASIGPITSGQLKRSGLKPDIQAKSYTFEGLTRAIVQYYQR